MHCRLLIVTLLLYLRLLGLLLKGHLLTLNSNWRVIRLEVWLLLRELRLELLLLRLLVLWCNLLLLRIVECLLLNVLLRGNSSTLHHLGLLSRDLLTTMCHICLIRLMEVLLLLLLGVNRLLHLNLMLELWLLSLRDLLLHHLMSLHHWWRLLLLMLKLTLIDILDSRLLICDLWLLLNLWLLALTLNAVRTLIS